MKEEDTHETRETRKWAIERAITSDVRHHGEIVKAAQAFVDLVKGTSDTEADKVKD